jgi:hypothetical protein
MVLGSETMVASSSKRDFLKNLPPKIKSKYKSRSGYRIPTEPNFIINGVYRREKLTNGCADYRDFLSKLALEGLDEAINRGGNIMQVAYDYEGSCDSPIYIDYAVLDYEKLELFCNFVDNGYIRCLQESVSYCIILGYTSRLTKVVCEKQRRSKPIYS